MRTTSLLAFLCTVLLGASFAGDAPLRLTARAPLTAEHDGAGTIADLPAGTPVAVLQRDGDRVRVRVEGWIPASALPPETAAPPPVPFPAPSQVAATTSIEGTISLDAKGMRKRKGAGAKVWLLPPGAMGPGDDAEDARIDALAKEMDRLEAEAAKALEGGPNFAEATRKHDQILATRSRVKHDRDDLVASVHARHEAIAQKAAVATAVADEQGIFRVEAAPGSYVLYARFLRESLDVEWVESVALGASVSRADLDETRARHLAP